MKETRGTAEWAYRCTPAGTGFETTRQLLDESGFLWRSLHNTAGHKVASVGKVEVGDTIHVYAVEAGTERYLSSHLVEAPNDLADVEAPAVEAVRVGKLFDQLSDAGYKLDATLGCFTGFRVKRDLYPRVLEQAPHWVGRNAIVRVKR